MKMTFDLSDELVRAIKMKAVMEDRRLKDLVEDLLRRGLMSGSAQVTGSRRRVKLPILEGVHPARPDEEMTPERVAALLAEQEVRGLDR